MVLARSDTCKLSPGRTLHSVHSVADVGRRVEVHGQVQGQLAWGHVAEVQGQLAWGQVAEVQGQLALGQVAEVQGQLA